MTAVDNLPVLAVGLEPADYAAMSLAQLEDIVDRAKPSEVETFRGYLALAIIKRDKRFKDKSRTFADYVWEYHRMSASTAARWVRAGAALITQYGDQPSKGQLTDAAKVIPPGTLSGRKPQAPPAPAPPSRRRREPKRPVARATPTPVEASEPEDLTQLAQDMGLYDDPDATAAPVPEIQFDVLPLPTGAGNLVSIGTDSTPVEPTRVEGSCGVPGCPLDGRAGHWHNGILYEPGKPAPVFQPPAVRAGIAHLLAHLLDHLSDLDPAEVGAALTEAEYVKAVRWWSDMVAARTSGTRPRCPHPVGRRIGNTCAVCGEMVR